MTEPLTCWTNRYFQFKEEYIQMMVLKIVVQTFKHVNMHINKHTVYVYNLLFNL